MYGYNDKLFREVLILCPFSRVIIAGSSLGPMICISIGSWVINVVDMDFISGSQT